MEIVGTCEVFDLDDSAGIGAVRRRASALAVAAGLDEVRAGDAALIATELASNVLKHAGHGGALLGAARDGDRRGVALAVWDRGPGMNVAACLRDGMSTAGTRGVGLGAVARIATRFDAYARPGSGSVVTATVLAERPAAPRFAVGGVSVPYPGLTVCGDAWDAHVDRDRATILVCDGLGHGDGAADAAAAAIAAFRSVPDAPLPEIMTRAHQAARATRGAAATVVRIDLARREVAVAGVGNVGAWLVGDTARQLVTQHGTLGQAAPPAFREERQPLAQRALVVVCSDGIKSRWSLHDHPGLAGHDPATIAAALWRDLGRGRDDATVVVVREVAPVIELGLVDIRGDDDIVRAHQTTRTIAAQLGFSSFEQTRIATAMSEIARNALTYASGGSVTFGLDDEREALAIVVLDRGPGIPELAAILSGERRSTTGLGAGIPGARRLMDSFAIESSPSGTRVEMTKRVPRRTGKVDTARIGTMRFQLAGQLADDPTQEIRRLQRDIAERDHRIVEITEELTETNRGVMALHAELEHRAEYQRRAVELRTRLLSEMGHELRTPLHSLSTISRFLIDRLDGELTDEQDKQVRIIHEVAESLTAYVNDLLDLARTDAGRAMVHLSRFQIDAVLRGLRRILQPLVPPAVALRVVIEPGLPVMASDEQKLSQVLRNLVANALKFTERGFVEVRARRTGDHVVFEVEDTGIGIAPEHHDLIFREFAQVDGHTEPRMRGSGLGLPLSRRLATLLGGTLTVASTPGSGSTFRLELPFETAGDAAQPAAAADTAPPVVTVTPRAGQPRVLIVDDDLASRYVLRRWLAGRYAIEEAETGQDGLRLAATRPDAIFLDVVMPDLTGFEVLEQLKADPVTRGIPVVVYTALTLGVHDRARLGEAVSILRKSTSSRVADRAAIEDALVKAGVAVPVEDSHV